jgi:hypothetical protein
MEKGEEDGGCDWSEAATGNSYRHSPKSGNTALLQRSVTTQPTLFHRERYTFTWANAAVDMLYCIAL